MPENEVNLVNQTKPTAAPPGDAPPIMPELSVEAPKKGGGISIKWWILALIVISLIAPYYFLYSAGFKKGSATLTVTSFTGPRLKTKYSNTSFPIHGIEANLKDANRRQFIHCSIQLDLRDDREITECSAKEPLLRDLLITILARYSSDDLSVASEVNKLKRLIKDEFNVNLKDSRVLEVFFTEFNMRILEPGIKRVPAQKNTGN